MVAVCIRSIFPSGLKKANKQQAADESLAKRYKLYDSWNLLKA